MDPRTSQPEYFCPSDPRTITGVTSGSIDRSWVNLPIRSTPCPSFVGPQGLGEGVGGEAEASNGCKREREFVYDVLFFYNL